ncbi:MAG: hypothetical protein IJL99_03960 [Firmicutes bacterium]|nr:hypothetical protein [Bacillota bacterium]
MSFRNNGHKRDPKYLVSSIFMLIIGLLCLYWAAESHFSTTWSLVVGAIVTFLAILMFKNANEQ